LRRLCARFGFAPRHDCARRDLSQAGLQADIDGDWENERWGEFFTRQTSEARDGEKVYSTKTHYESAARSMKEFEEKLRNSKQIIERGKALDKADRPIGERAVVLTTLTDGTEATLIIRTMDEYFTEIRSRSQQDAVEFEKQFRPKLALRPE
jgi:hypothetical protein